MLTARTPYETRGVAFAALLLGSQRHCQLSKAEEGLIRATIDGEAIDFQMREKGRQVRIPKENPRGSHLSQELVGTGKLLFAIRTYLRGPHNEEWCETDQNPLENQLP